MQNIVEYSEILCFVMKLPKSIPCRVELKQVVHYSVSQLTKIYETGIKNIWYFLLIVLIFHVRHVI